MKLTMEVNQPVEFTVLGRSESKSISHIAKASTYSVELSSDRSAQPGDAVKIEKNASLFLGEVSFCRPAGERFVIGVELRHALYNTNDLARLAKRLLEATSRL
jgi:hypothetical protein